jgi:tripartite-type tricarboxylate transporter receptor subunit TctC
MKHIIRLMIGLACLACGSARAAGTFPDRPVRFIVPYAAGGGTDIIARVIGQKLSEFWGQGVVIDNRPGAGSSIGTALAVKAPPDGYTMLMSSISLAFDAAIYRHLPYDPVRDLAPVSLVALQPNILVVNPSLPAKSVADLIALAKAKPGTIPYASGGNGSGPHLAMELFKSMAGVDLLHIPYKGTAPALNDLVGGQVQVMISVTVSAMPMIKSGLLRALAVTGSQRSPGLPEVPTIAESGVPNYQFTTWYGIQVPAHTPADIVMKLNADVIRAEQAPDVRARLEALGVDQATSSAAEFGDMVRSEIARWTKVADGIGLKSE